MVSRVVDVVDRRWPLVGAGGLEPMTIGTVRWLQRPSLPAMPIAERSGTFTSTVTVLDVSFDPT